MFEHVCSVWENINKITISASELSFIKGKVEKKKIEQIEPIYSEAGKIFFKSISYVQDQMRNGKWTKNKSFLVSCTFYYFLSHPK